MKKKILIIFGTRPEFLKLIKIIEIIRNKKKYDLKVLNTSQHSDLLTNHLSKFKVKINFSNKSKKFNNLADNSIYLSKYINSKIKLFKPNLIIYQGDTLTAFLASFLANLNSIQSMHVEAGLRTFDVNNPWPEENFRTAIKNFATYHCAPTSIAKKNLLKEKIKSSDIRLTGNTIVDILEESITRYDIKNPSLFKNVNLPFVYVTIHRRENIGYNLNYFCNFLNKVSKKYKDLFFIIPVHSNPKIKFTIKKLLRNNKKILLIQPLDYIENLRYIYHSSFVISDSGGIQEEVASLNKNLLIFRKVTERPEILKSYGMLANCNNLSDKFNKLYKQSKINHKRKNPFGDGQASIKIYNFINEII